jgi:hypothetical protein
MELLDRYLQAVKKHLPWKRQDDIIAELKANLESQLEDREAELGRPLTQGEMEDWLRQIGAPIQVAARYQPQQYLIGPAVFPMYWYVLRTALFWALIIYSIASTITIAMQVPNVPATLEAVLRVPAVLMTVATWVTLIFAVIEFVVTHYPEKCPARFNPSAPWSPSCLPPLEKEPSWSKKPRSLSLALAEVIFGFLVLVWLLLIPQHPFLILGPGAAYLHASSFQLSPVCIQFYWWIVALSILQLGWRCLSLARGTWQKPQRAQHFVFKTLGLIPLALLLTAQDHVLFLLRNPALDQARFGDALNQLNKGVYAGLRIVFAIVVLQLLWDLWNVILEARRKRKTAQ